MGRIDDLVASVGPYSTRVKQTRARSFLLGVIGLENRSVECIGVGRARSCSEHPRVHGLAPTSAPHPRPLPAASGGGERAAVAASDEPPVAGGPACRGAHAGYRLMCSTGMIVVLTPSPERCRVWLAVVMNEQAPMAFGLRLNTRCPLGAKNKGPGWWPGPLSEQERREIRRPA
jgi:hypothetical protein